jgi:hypothetical protein
VDVSQNRAPEYQDITAVKSELGLGEVCKWFESQNFLVRSVEVSEQLSNQSIREEIQALWSMTRGLGNS